MHPQGRRSHLRKGPVQPRFTLASLVLGTCGMFAIMFAQWIRWMGGRGDPLSWTENTDGLVQETLPTLLPCASRHGFGVSQCANMTADTPVAYRYPLVNAPYMGAFREPAFTHLDVFLSNKTPEQSIVVRGRASSLSLSAGTPLANP